MSAPTLPAEGASTVARKWLPEINTGTSGAPVWAALEAITTSQFSKDNGNLEDDSTFAGGGYTSQTKSSAAWAYTATVSRKTQGGDPTAYGVCQEFLREKAIGKFGPANTVEVRIFEFDVNDPDGTESPRVEAYHGFAGVTWDDQGGAVTALDMVQITLFGQGKLDVIAHPYPATATVPTVETVSPANVGTAGGDAVVIHGYNFTGATAVTFGGTAATDHTINSDTEIVAITPAKTAGAAQVVVTNTTGPSTNAVDVTYA